MSASYRVWSKSIGSGVAGAFFAAALITMTPRDVLAGVFPWQTEPAVGPSEVAITLDLICLTGGLVCDLLDAYDDTQTASLSGSGGIDVDDISNTITFQQDSSQDLGMGLIPGYSTLSASDLTFAEIPLAGTPMTESSVLFATTNPSISVPGLDLNLPGDYPFTGDVDYALIADIIGDLDPLVPMLISMPDSVTLSGVLRVLAGGGGELRDVTGTFNYQDTVALLGEMPTLSIASDIALNLSVQLPPPVLQVPALSRHGIGLAIALMIAVAGIARPSVTRPAVTKQEDQGAKQNLQVL